MINNFKKIFRKSEDVIICARDKQRTKASSQILFGSMVAKYDTIKSGNRMLTEFFNFSKS